MTYCVKFALGHLTKSQLSVIFLLNEYTLIQKSEKRKDMPRTEEANQRIREERREQILDVASRVFARKGLAGTRIADIAAEGEISQGLIFRYFASKEEVFAAVIEKALQSATGLARAALQQPGSPLDKLRWLLQVSFEGMWRKPDYMLVVLPVLNSENAPPEIRELVLEESQHTLQLYRRLIIEGQESGEIVESDPDMLTLTFAACIQGISSSVTYLPRVLSIDGPPDPEVVLRILRV
jgi:AcrR family transcriptional regulator